MSSKRFKKLPENTNMEKPDLINNLIDYQHNNYKYFDEIEMNDFLVSAVSFLT